jgi:hypothetical protein
MEQGVFEAGMMSGGGIDPSQVLGYQNEAIPGNTQVFNVTFPAPAVTGSIVVVAQLGDGSFAVAALQVT